MARTFDLLPAIDLRGGAVVRLLRGDFERETRYADDPVAVAERFMAAGARWLHLVDLDGARAGEPRQTEIIDAVVRAVGKAVEVEVAGGLRDGAAVERVLASGARRVVLGTAALRAPGLAGDLVHAFGPGRVAVAIDVRDGRALGDGWVATSAGVDAAEAIRALADVGVTTFEVTAIDRDGTGRGPDLELYRDLIGRSAGDIIASAGIASIDDIAAVRAAGCAGAIIGRALYDGTVDLASALAG